MPVSNKLKSAVKKQLLQEEPLMNVEEFRLKMLGWLAQFDFPAYPDARSWTEVLRSFPTLPGEETKESGLKVRLTLYLYTRQCPYLITVIENFNPDSRGVYILSAHVNWKGREKRLQRTLESGYTGKFDDILRAKHTVWAQTFRESEFIEALNSCAVAMLGRELEGQAGRTDDGQPVIRTGPYHATFPQPDND